MHFSPQEVARQLDISVLEYKELENGNVLLTYALARKLAKLYDSEAKFFYEAAQQLDQFLTNEILVKTLKADNEHLRKELEKLNG
jgi:transcriptional regulator with XRE-family HTH domain